MSDRSTVLVLGAVADDHDLVDHLDETYDVVTRTDSNGSIPAFDLCVADHDALADTHQRIIEQKHDAGGVFLPCLFLRDEPDDDLPDWELSVVDDVVTWPADPNVVLDHVASLLDHRARTVDLAEQKQRELRQQEALTETAIEALPDLFYVFAPDGSLRRWNEKSEEITGYDAKELDGMNALDLLPATDREWVAAQILEVLEDGSTRTIEVDLVTSDESVIPYEFKVAPLYDVDDTLVGGVGVGRDITDRRMRHELTRQNERLERFASIVSHDLRNPIAVANGFLDLAAQDCDSPHLERVEHAIGRMETLIDDLLALARQGTTVDDPGALSLADVALSAWSGVDSGAATLDIETDQDLFADESRLQQLFENLFRNAIEHGGAEVTVTVGDTPGGFYVADDGPGIPEDQREGVFEYGYTTSEEGTGFGLAIVEQIAEAHGWSVSIAEHESGGARFEFAGVDRPLPSEYTGD